MALESSEYAKQVDEADEDSDGDDDDEEECSPRPKHYGCESYGC
jgi:hypothetical protein